MTTNKKKPAESTTTAKAAEEAVEVGQETAEKLMKAGMDATAKSCEQAFSFSQAQAEKTMNTIFKQYDGLADLGKENMELFTKTGNALSNDYQELARVFMDIAQNTLKRNMEVSEAVVGAKNLKEVTDIQTSYVKESFETAINNGNQVVEITTKITNDVVEPIRKQVSQSMEKVFQGTA